MSNDLKNRCYSSQCDIVDTGFRFNSYKVCKYCKVEISQDLAKRIGDEAQLKKDRENEARGKDEEADQYRFWEYL